MILSNQELLSMKSQIPEWEHDSYSHVLKRIFLFPDFASTMSFVNKVATIAESLVHHPIILIEYNKVTLTLSTHDEEGITKKDVDLALAISAIQ